MSDHIPDTTKMISDTPRMGLALRKAQEDCTESYLLTEGLKLERELNAANERIPLLIAERDTARRQADQNYKLREEFTELLGTDDVEQGVAVVREMNERIKRLEEELERTKQDRNAIAKKTREPLLLKLDEANERIKRLEKAGDLLKDRYILENENWDLQTVNEWNEAKEVKP